MNPIAIWHHSYLSGGDPPPDASHSLRIVIEQMTALEESGLSRSASEIHLCVNGSEADHIAVCCCAPEKARVIHHQSGHGSELPTLKLVQDWVKDHPGWYVLYHHTKGACYPGNELWRAWRLCMQHVVVDNWRQCVKDLDDGYDCVGAHWLTPQKYPDLMTSPYFGGNFFWATTKHLSRLDPIDMKASRWAAEAWLGYTKERILARGYANHFPGAACMAAL